MAEERERRWREALDRHDQEERAHAVSRHAQTNDWIARFQVPMERRQLAIEVATDRRFTQLETRMSATERWQQRAAGALAVISLMIGGGILGLIYEVATSTHR